MRCKLSELNSGQGISLILIFQLFALYEESLAASVLSETHIARQYVLSYF